jgi:Flp pilus assembly protein TadB
VASPLLREYGDRLSKLAGITEPLDRRLSRLHSPLDVDAFRLRQVAWCLTALIAAAGLAAAAPVPQVVKLLVVAGAPILAFLVVEQRLVRATDKWRGDVSLEMPVIAEQLAMLLNAGYSLGSAIARLAERGSGVVSIDFGLIVNRVRQGLSESDALEEWSDRARVEPVTRLVSVLTVHSHTADLGRLVSAEARASRRDLHRRTIETIERRAQQVWVPVTVATLIPGVILLSVPFLSALGRFSNA